MRGYGNAETKSDDAIVDREAAERGKEGEGKLFYRFPQRSEWREDEGRGGERPSVAWLLGNPQTHPCSACFAP